MISFLISHAVVFLHSAEIDVLQMFSRVLFCETALIFIGYGFKRVLRDCELTQPHAITQAAAEATPKVHSM